MLIAKQNREKLFNKLQPNSVAIIPGNKLKYRSSDVEYSFRQNSNFYYLTGLTEPNALAVFISEKKQFILFTQEPNTDQEIWTGPIIGPNNAIELFGADMAYPINQIDSILPNLLINKDILYYPMLEDLELEANLYKWRLAAKKLARAQHNKAFPDRTENLSVILHELRVIKSSLEIKKIRYVTEISSRAHEHVIKYVATNNKKFNLTERAIQAEFYNYCLQHGCQDMAYSPIVASGANACILHYTKNLDVLKKQDLVLIDAGAEFDYYAADITRVFPVDGKFSKKQRDLYQLVLHAQTQAINIIKPGLLWSELQKIIVREIVEGLIDLKLLSGNIDDLINNNDYKKFYMHGSGHFLGMDVHDPSIYKIDNQFRPLLPGMVLTVEPGIYYNGTGIRIEDDILVTEQGHEILTNAIKSIDDIEHLMK